MGWFASVFLIALFAEVLQQVHWKSVDFLTLWATVLPVWAYLPPIRSKIRLLSLWGFWEVWFGVQFQWREYSGWFLYRIVGEIICFVPGNTGGRVVCISSKGKNVNESKSGVGLKWSRLGYLFPLKVHLCVVEPNYNAIVLDSFEILALEPTINSKWILYKMAV